MTLPVGLKDYLHQTLRVPGSSAALLDDQARALFQAWDQNGLVAGMGCGAGKTLLSLLLPAVLAPKQRPVLLVPASLVEKTRLERAGYAKDWLVADPVVLSYQELGRDSGAGLLDAHMPDLIVSDECHRLKNLDAAVTRRVARYLDARPDTLFCGLSGTLVRHGLADYAHLLLWALRERAPVPSDPDQLRVWCDLLTEGPGGSEGFLFKIPKERRNGVPTKTEFRDRLASWPGVVLTQGVTDCAASLRVRALEYDPGEEVEKAFRTLREAWELPDGWMLSEPTQVAEAARQLALGFYYALEPRPTSEFYEARRNWNRYVRHVLTHTERWDSPAQVEAATDAGYTQGQEKLRIWRKEEAAYRGVQECRVISIIPQKQVERWAREPGIIWVNHVAFGHALVARFGFPYYGEDGRDALTGRSIESERGDRPIVASWAANSTGRNLQRFNRMLVTAPMSAGLDWEQTLSRCHRAGQLADEVVCDVLLGCKEHLSAVQEARRQTSAVLAREGLRWRLGYCDMDPTWYKACNRIGYRWDNPGTQ